MVKDVAAADKCAADCEAEWADFRPDGTSPVAYAAEMQLHQKAQSGAVAAAASFSPLSADMSGDLRTRLLARFPEHLGWLPDDAAFRRLPDGEVTLAHGGRSLQVKTDTRWTAT